LVVIAPAVDPRPRDGILAVLAESLTGPVHFRSNGGERKLPDLVTALHSQIDVNHSVRCSQTRTRHSLLGHLQGVSFDEEIRRL
jgi:hypothetical protein